MTLNDLLAQIEILSDADKRTLVAKVTQMLPESPKVLAETALADIYTVNVPAAAENAFPEDPYLAALRAKIEADFARPISNGHEMMQQGMFRGRVPLDESLFELAKWHPSEEELTGE